MAALTRGSRASSTCAHVHPPKDMPVTAQLLASSRPAKRLSAPAASAPILSSRKSRSAGRSASICARVERAPPGLTTSPSSCV